MNILVLRYAEEAELALGNDGARGMHKAYADNLG